MKVSESGEFGLIDALRRLLEGAEGDLVCGAGDDAAVFRDSAGRLWAYTADALVEGVHFMPAYTPWYSLGFKALAVNLSDLAAMGGGGPSYALVVLGLRGEEEVSRMEEMYRGLSDCARRFSCRVAGGDVVHSPERTFLSVSLVGTLEGEGFLARSGARPGQAVLITGTLGDSWLGLQLLMRGGGTDDPCARRHLYPEPRLEEGLAAFRLGATAAIDVSDGLLRDAGHICEESGVGMEIYMESIPISEDARRLAVELGMDPLRAALAGGEDYELVITVDERLAPLLAEKLPATIIGRVTEGEGVVLVDAEGRPFAAPETGYEHFREA
ncbi:thiamine-phosphate kinase [Candidatus Solincola sp.]|nr:thiamine-phosphate kinase [Actinomycetota bacterium]